MERAYYALTDVGPYRTSQVVVLDEQDGWTRTGFLRELADDPAALARVHERAEADQPILIPVRI